MPAEVYVEMAMFMRFIACVAQEMYYDLEVEVGATALDVRCRTDTPDVGFALAY